MPPCARAIGLGNSARPLSKTAPFDRAAYRFHEDVPGHEPLIEMTVMSMGFGHDDATIRRIVACMASKLPSLMNEHYPATVGRPLDEELLR